MLTFLSTSVRPKLVLIAGLAILTWSGSQALRAAAPYDPSLYSGLKWRMLGPFRGGRVDAVTGVPGRPNEFYMGAVNGGVWKTIDAGRVWTPVFDGQPVACTIDAMGYAFARRRNGAWVPPSDRRLQRQAWPAGLAIALPAEGPRRLVFDAMGMPSDPFAAVLSADGTARRVSVARDGTVRVNAAP